MASFKEYLQRNAKISEDDFNRISGDIRYATFSKRERILNLGEVCKDVLFVEKGLLRSYTIDDAGKEHVIQFAPENWFISDRGSLFFNAPSSIIIEAIEDTEAVIVHSGFMEQIAVINDNFRVFNDQLLHRHIKNLQDRINELLGATAEQRYISFVNLYPDLMLRVPQWMIASYLGITPESLSRVRKELAMKARKSSQVDKYR